MIEMMTVLVVVALLAAISLPIYRNFVAKAQLSAALAQIEPGRSMIESAFADAVDPSLVDVGYIGLPVSTERCALINVSLAPDGRSTLSCRVIGGSSVDGRTLSLQRSVAGIWRCDASAFDARYKPSECD
ncbi:type IV pilus assembly protein PilA [Xanthomonas arboricola]|nr:type IV pilus assembly protein PilA [Xanthomonas sp. 3307]